MLITCVFSMVQQFNLRCELLLVLCYQQLIRMLHIKKACNHSSQILHILMDLNGRLAVKFNKRIILMFGLGIEVAHITY